MPTSSDDKADELQTLHSLVKALPYELFIEIFAIALQDQSNVGKLMSLSKSLNEELATHAYAQVTLSSAESVERFYNLIRLKPDFGRKVKALWIGPTELHSDLLAALAPPESVMCRSVNLREQVYVYTKFILRTCRKVENLALSGGLCIPDAAFSYGTACQPKRLTCVNPHSFVGAFSAPIFNKVVELHLIDTSLAIEDGDQISKMQSLRHFIWSSPKEDSDPAQEAARIHRMVLQSLNGELPPNMTAPYIGMNDTHFSLPLPPNIADKLSTRAKLLERITLATSQGRCVDFRRSILPLHEMQLDESEDDADSMDSGIFLSTYSGASKKKGPAAAESSAARAQAELARDKSIRVRAWALEPNTIDEWQALREEVCSVSFKWGEVRARQKTAREEAEGADDGWLADGRKALRVFHQRWLASL